MRARRWRYWATWTREAIYAILVRDLARWEKLYTSDGWGAAQTKMMKDALGGTADGEPRPKLIEKYMEFLFPAKFEKTEFLGKGTDADGKADFQGCSEFNPAMVFSKAEQTAFDKLADKTKRNEENRINRRVLVYFFRPGTVVPAEKWACPRAKENTAGCRKRLWSDQSTRRSNTAERREFAKTQDTFGCRFYHRLALKSPCEQPGNVTPVPTGNILVTWKPAKAHCGDDVTMTVETVVPGVTTVHVDFDTIKVTSTKPPEAVDLTLVDGKATWKWKVKNIGFLEGKAFFGEEELKAVATGGTAMGTGSLVVEALSEGAKESFNETRAWSGFTNHSQWDQKIEKFRNKVDVKFDVRKAWGGTYIDLTGFVTETAGGCPWDKHRWGRSTVLNAMQPNQYYNGTAWVALPVGFTAGATNYQGTTFVKSGTKFVGRNGGEWPEAFAEYDFDSAKYTKKRADWCKTTHDVWTDQFPLHRKTCASEKGTHCCLYSVEVNMAFNTVTTGDTDVVYMAPGSWRANAANWAMDDSNLQVAAHEAGHHMDNPDEYAGGAVNPTVNGDGAVNGIDANCIMGQNLTVAKKRHYGGFVAMLKRIIKTKYGKDYEYEAIDK